MATTIQQRAAVYFAASWEDEWELQEHVFCDNFSLVAGPDVSEATLQFAYGFVQPVESSANGPARAKKDAVGHWVRIELTQFTEDDEESYRYWYGSVVQIDDNQFGKTTSRGEQAESGIQTFHCRGLEFQLMRKTLKSSFVLLEDETEAEIGRAIAFNLGQGRDNDHDRHGNKSESPGENDAHIFAFDVGVGGVSTNNAKLWSVQDIITYLFNYHPPKDADSHDPLNWQVADGGDAEVLAKFFPTCQAEGKTIKQILDEIIDRRRLVGYTIDVVGDDETPKLNVFTFNKDSLSLAGETTIPANSNQTTWFYDGDGTIQSAVLSEDDATRFDVVIARGAPLTSVLTIGNSGDYSTSMIKDWDDTQKTAYNTGASGAGSYSALVSVDKQAANQAFRSDSIFEKVFRAFLLASDFSGSIDGNVVCPDPSKEGEDEEPSSEKSPFWWPGLRFLDTLTLRTDFDYTTVEDFETTSKTTELSQPDYLRPFAVTVIGSGTLYYRLDRPGQGKMTAELLKDDGIVWAASLRMQDDCPGLFIDVHGAPQHVIASAEFTPADADDTLDSQSVIDWKKILCTVCLEFDQHVEAKFPEGEATAEGDVLRELIIYLPQYRLDYLTPGAVVGVDDAGALLVTDGGYVRDDRAFLEDIARCAYEWYGHERKALQITRQSLLCEQVIGELITSVGSEDAPTEVNSVVTKIVFDVLNNTVTVFTQYAELDFSR